MPTPFPSRTKEESWSGGRTEGAAQPTVVEVAAGHEQQQRHGPYLNPPFLYRKGRVCGGRVTARTPRSSPEPLSGVRGEAAEGDQEAAEQVGQLLPVVVGEPG